MSEDKKDTNNHQQQSEPNDDNHREALSSQKEGKKISSVLKIKALKEKLRAAEQEAAELKDLLLRKSAEFDNYRKRRESELGQLISNANADLLASILPVLDDLERSTKMDPAAVDGKVLFQGVELIYKNLAKVLESQGVKPIQAIGQPFDPEKHSALLQVERNDQPPGTVVDEHLKGYVMNDRVLRHSQVLVSK
jgi:molecular chaperone GrpE